MSDCIFLVLGVPSFSVSFLKRESHARVQQTECWLIFKQLTVYSQHSMFDLLSTSEIAFVSFPGFRCCGSCYHFVRSYSLSAPTFFHCAEMFGDRKSPIDHLDLKRYSPLSGFLYVFLSFLFDLFTVFLFSLFLFFLLSFKCY